MNIKLHLRYKCLYIEQPVVIIIQNAQIAQRLKTEMKKHDNTCTLIHIVLCVQYNFTFFLCPSTYYNVILLWLNVRL